MGQMKILLDIAIILISSKILGLIARKIGLPEVTGFLIAGILVGPAIWSPAFNGFSIVEKSEFLNVLAQIGVIMLMFSAGLETDFTEMKKSGVKAFVIALFGVLVPMGLGMAVSIPFLGTENILSAVFIGTILAATSVGITVAALRELGVLKGRVGTTIVSAAIIDDILGMIALSVVIGFKDVNEKPLLVIGKIALFFVCAVLLGKLISIIINRLGRTQPHKRRIPILCLGVCFLYAWAAEALFGVADITGAYIAGLILSFNKSSAEYIDRKIEINSYMFFAPIFFTNIGIKMSFNNLTPHLLLFGVCVVGAGMVGKIVGCGGSAWLLKYKFKDSLKIGVGMLTRGEVALVVAEKGISAGLIDESFMTIIVLLILVTSLLGPILLKLLYRSDTVLAIAPPDGLLITEAACVAEPTPQNGSSEQSKNDMVTGGDMPQK
jgi:Kef-type K+ transport system membrane component KefB